MLLALAFRGPLQWKCTAYFLLRSEAPSEEVLSDAVEHASDPGALLRQFWHTHRLRHREFVLGYLSRVSSSKPDLFREMEPLVVEATADPDAEVRQLAFVALEWVNHPQLRQLAMEQLSDADPALRLLGLQRLLRAATSNDVPLAMGLLGDPEPRVVVAAAQVLRRVTGRDFGIKTTHALPQFTCINTNPPPAPNMPAINQGVQRWRDWWTGHRAEYPAGPSTPPGPRRVAPFPAPDFSLEDSGGKPRRLEADEAHHLLRGPRWA